MNPKPEEPGPRCLGLAGLVWEFFAGRATLSAIETILEHLPACSRCSETFDNIGRELGVIKAKWQEQLHAYDPLRMLGTSDKPVLSLVVLAAQIRHVAALRPMPAFRGSPAMLEGCAGDITMRIVRVEGGFEISACGPEGNPVVGALVQLVIGELPVAEERLDAAGRAVLTAEVFDTIVVTAVS